MSFRVDPSSLIPLQKNTKNIRNFCILAHVDHGKTTLSDSIISTNGVISPKLAGKLRYLDCTEEEQKRGITMHSSAISLLFKPEERKGNVSPIKPLDEDSEENQEKKEIDEYLINLVDSPGHIDFSHDVSTATRLCDGALIVVDVLEGLCTQTHAVLYKALKERMRPCLVLNKIDRLALEMQLSPVEAFHYLRRIVENANALAFTLLTAEFRSMREELYSTTGIEDDHNYFDEDNPDPLFAEWTFSPEKGNVIFACALDCWGFGVPKFANIWAKKLGVNKNVIQKYLFEDYSLNPTTKKISKCDINDYNSKPMFATMILEPIWQLYDVCITQKDPTKAAKMALRGCGVELPPREINTRDPRLTAQAIFRRWLPLPDAILRMVVRCMPNPIEAQQSRIHTLLADKFQSTPLLPSLTITANVEMEKRMRLVSSSIKTCNSHDDDVVVFVSKMAPVRVAELSPRDKAMYISKYQDKHDGELPLFDNNSEVFIALARVFSGILKRDSKLFVLGHRHDPLATQKDTDYDLNGEIPSNFTAVTKIPINSFGLYICLGPSIFPCDETPAGNIVGIFGLDDQILKTATISNTWACPPMKAITFQAKPMVCVAVEPLVHQDLPLLELGLAQLYQFDPVVEIGVDESGQHTMTCLGELHLEQCLKILSEKFAKCELRASEPLVFYRETVLSCDSTYKPQLPIPWCNIEGVSDAIGGHSTCITSSSNLSISFRCLPLPHDALTFLENEPIGSEKLSEFLSTKKWIKRISTNGQFVEENPEISSFMAKLHSKLIDSYDSNFDDIYKGKQTISKSSDGNNEVFEDILNRLISLGPRSILSNLLILNPNIAIDVYASQVPPSSSAVSSSISNQEEDIIDHVDTLLLSITLAENYEIFAKIWQRLYSPISTGFHVATSAGSLMQENVYGVCFSVEKINIIRSSISFISDKDLMACNSNKTVFTSTLSLSTGDISNIETGQIIPKVRDALRFAMLASPVRIVEPIYACDLQCDQHQLGNLYSVLARRRGEVVKEDIIDGTSLFLLSATLPVAESFGFASELLKKTSGNATAPQLRFSHWQINNTDPFWKPTTAEELEDHGGYVSIESNMTRVIIDKIRKRKGLQVEEKVVASAEKQRTLTKNK